MDFRSMLRLAAVLAAASGMLGAAEPERLLGKLASEDFKTRKQAAEELASLARKDAGETRKLCLRHFLTTADPEIRQGCKAVLMELLHESFGFIGIQHSARNLFDRDGQLAQGIEVRAVMPGMPAEKAGMQVGDVIVALDGKLFDPAEVAEDFSRRVRLKGPGRKIKLQVERSGEKQVVPLTTVAAPQEVVALDPEARFAEWLGAQAKPAPP